MIETKLELPASHPLEMLITSREKDLGGFHVRRLLPYMSHRMVGPFLFFDHMGPATFEPHVGMDVRPHPHTHLATVSYLFEGAIRHHDSLGSDQVIEPGAINLMTAGHGIVHSERTPEPIRTTGGRMNGIQVWIALPEAEEDCEPAFSHHPASVMPDFKKDGLHFRVLMGSAFGATSPVPLRSDLFYVEVRVPKGATLTINEPSREVGAYVVSGSLECEGVVVDHYTMAIVKNFKPCTFTAREDSHVMVFGGVSLGPRFLFWNFVASTQAKLEQAKRDYANGPGGHARFPKVPGDDQEFIPLPDEPKRGTPM